MLGATSSKDRNYAVALPHCKSWWKNSGLGDFSYFEPLLFASVNLKWKCFFMRRFPSCNTKAGGLCSFLFSHNQRLASFLCELTCLGQSWGPLCFSSLKLSIFITVSWVHLMGLIIFFRRSIHYAPKIYFWVPSSARNIKSTFPWGSLFGLKSFRK